MELKYLIHIFFYALRMSWLSHWYIAFKFFLLLFFFLFCFDYFCLFIILRLFFYISYEYSFIPRYIGTYICNTCIPSDCMFFHLMCRREYREKTWKTYIYIFLINFVINNILSENLLTNVRCFLLELCLTRKVLRETGEFVALLFFF